MTDAESEQESFLKPYFLESIPKSGTKYVLSPMMNSVDNFSKLSVNVYPNPTTSHIKIMGVEGDYVINIYGMEGKKLNNYKNNVIELGNYESGVYIHQGYKRG